MHLLLKHVANYCFVDDHVIIMHAFWGEILIFVSTERSRVVIRLLMGKYLYIGTA